MLWPCLQNASQQVRGEPYHQPFFQTQSSGSSRLPTHRLRDRKRRAGSASGNTRYCLELAATSCLPGWLEVPSIIATPAACASRAANYLALMRLAAHRCAHGVLRWIIATTRVPLLTAFGVSFDIRKSCLTLPPTLCERCRLPVVAAGGCWKSRRHNNA